MRLWQFVSVITISVALMRITYAQSFVRNGGFENAMAWRFTAGCERDAKVVHSGRWSLRVVSHCHMYARQDAVGFNL